MLAVKQLLSRVTWFHPQWTTTGKKVSVDTVQALHRPDLFIKHLLHSRPQAFFFEITHDQGVQPEFPCSLSRLLLIGSPEPAWRGQWQTDTH